MGFFDKLNGPVLYKDSTEMKSQLESLKNLQETASDENQKLIAQDLRLLQYGDLGEENVQFELMHSFMPMLVLRDLQLEYEDMTAQLTLSSSPENWFLSLNVRTSLATLRSMMRETSSGRWSLEERKSRKEYIVRSHKTEGISKSLKPSEKRTKEIF